MGIIGIATLIMAESTILVVSKIYRFFNKFIVDKTDEKEQNSSKFYIDDFLMKHPNATVDDNGIPYVRPCLLGYQVKTNFFAPPLGCVYCWKQTMKNDELF